MKIIFDHSTPFCLAHGGLQIQIEQAKKAIEEAGVEVNYLRWWDSGQKADLIQYYGRPHPMYIELAHKKGMKVVILELLTGLGSRGAAARFLQSLVVSSLSRLLPSSFLGKFGWQSYRTADACIANTEWERSLMQNIFGARPERCHLVPNGVEKIFFEASPGFRGQWLVCTATIAPRKRVLELAQGAVAAKTPLWIIGKPYGEDAYSKKFLDFAHQNSGLIRYEGPVEDRNTLAKIYREARGFVLLSTMETRSLSSEEAAAAQCPLLLSDLPWARSVFEESACYLPHDLPREKLAKKLKYFYETAPSLPLPSPPKLWSEVAKIFIAVYRSVLNAPGDF